MKIAHHIQKYNILIALSFAFSFNQVFAVTIYVKEGSAGDGSSWTTAYGSLQSALNIAGSSDQIWVSAGSYMPSYDYGIGDGNNRYYHFQMINGVAIYGGFPNTGNPVWVDRDPTTYESILTGDIGTPGNTVDNCYHIFYHPSGIGLDATAILDGFTITGGNADGGGWPHDYGGGMINEYCSPMVTNCTFTGNTALYGGGMENYISDPTVTDCIFSNNLATGDELYMPAGGGMSNEYCNPVVTGCTFTGNTALYGGGMDNYYSNPLVAECIFSENSAAYGAGMDNLSGSPFVTDCTFNNNTASGNSDSAGGGMSNFLEDGPAVISNPTVMHCVFSGNSALYGAGMENEYRNPMVKDCIFNSNTADDGGGIYNFFSIPNVMDCHFNGNTALYGGGISNEDSNSLVVSCTFSGNTADYGGGMENYSSLPTITNCTFSRNTADYGGGISNEGSSSTLTNNIFWSNTATSAGNEIYNNTSTPIIAYCDISGGLPVGSTDGGGNIDGNPLFVRIPDDGGDGWGNANDDYGDLRLQGGSPCIDAANGDAAPNTDIIGNSRVDDPTISNTGVGNPSYADIGAYESPDPCLGRNEADLDCNGIVNMADFASFASHWLE